MLVSSSFLFISWLVASSSQFNVDSIDDCAKALGQYIQKTFAWVTNEKEILEYYSSFVEVEKFDPRAELKKSKERIEEYIAKRAEFAFKAKVSLEAREVPDWPNEEVNDPDSKNFIRFLSAKRGSDGTIVYKDDYLGQARKIDPSKNMSVHPNANFYGLNTSSIGSAVHVPTPLYDRNPKMLKAIEWSDIDSVYRTNRDETRDLAFQMFCSANGFMRYFPAATWFWDNADEGLDLFDCRNTEWYINAATNSKNMLIMIDMSGSMLGQRYEIAKQTTEAILETLSHNDYFNIMQFSKEAAVLDSCNGTAGLLQATMRNKKHLRDKMNFLSAEGKSDYGAAFKSAFNLLHNITESNGRGDQGCTKVIMLITDGAPSSYKDTFDTYNKDKSVRVFTFLIGDEAIDFEQVTQIACYNRGFMVHIQNMADVAEKVQAYIRTMSQSVGAHKSEIGIDDPLWSGVYRERLYLPRPEKYADNKMTNSSQRTLRRQAYKQKIQIQRVEARTRMFVTTVSYPVIVNNSFMGVAAVNIPLTEIYQKAHPSNIGARSYFFLLDQNGFVMSHPELRPINPTTKQHKPNYNNMDLLELEVVTHTIIRRDALTEVFCEKGTTYAECAEEIRQVFKALILNCDNTDPQTLNTLFSMRSDQYYESENVDRVYPQTNTYYTECLKGSNFILGLAVAEGDDYRTRRKDHQKGYDYSKVNPEKWIGDAKYIRIHPYWRYCFLNDTDTNITKEEAFLTYAKQMKQTGKLPALCEGRKILVDKLLADLEATSALYDAWNVDWPKFKQNNIHLVFFAAPSGLIRFYNNTLDDYRYEDIHQNIFEFIGSFFSSSQDKEVYQHFVVDVNSKSSEDSYYRRAVRMKDTIFLDTTNSSKLWYNSSEMLTAYGLNENFTMCAHAFKAIHMGEALLGIAGFEFVYDYVVNLLSERGCPVSDNRRWCVLIDEHGYIFYSNQKGISYEDYCEDPLKKGKHISHWFGSVNRISQRAMQLLVENKFYTKTVYTDYQAICKEKESSEVTWDNTLRNPLRHIVSFLFRFLYRSIQFIKNFSFYPLIQNLFFMKSIEAYTASFHESGNGYSCAISSTFYLANQDEATRPKTSVLIPGNRADRPCKMNTKCAVKFYASFVEGTNLIMVWMNQDKVSENCYDEAQCPLDDPSEVPFKFEEASKKPEEATCKPQKRSPRSQAMCYAADPSEDNEPCSSTVTIQMLAALSLPVLLNFLSILLHF